MLRETPDDRRVAAPALHFVVVWKRLVKNESSLSFYVIFSSLGGIQEAIFEEKIFRIFSTKKSSFILAGTSKQDYIWISY